MPSPLTVTRLPISALPSQRFASALVVSANAKASGKIHRFRSSPREQTRGRSPIPMNIR